MTKTMNKTIIIGRLGKDPELHHGQKTEYTNFSISDKTFRNGQEEVQWHKICAFGKQAVLVHQHLRKGDLCCVEGRLDSHAYEKNGEKHTSHSVIAERITFLSTKRRSNANNDQPMENDFNEAFPG